jgi:hypothetical protein
MASLTLEPNGVDGNYYIHASIGNYNGDGSLEVQGTTYCDFYQPYMTGGMIKYADNTFIDTTGLKTTNLTSSGVVTFTNALSTPSGGTGLSSIVKGNILVGGGPAQPVQTSPAFAYDTTTATFIASNATFGTLKSNGTVVFTVPLTVPSGGTGRSSLTSNQLLYGSGTDVVGQSGNLMFDSTLNKFSVTGSLSVTGATTLSTLNATNGSFSGTLGVTGVLSGTSLNVSGPSVLTNTTLTNNIAPLLTLKSTGSSNLSAGEIRFLENNESYGYIQRFVSDSSIDGLDLIYLCNSVELPLSRWIQPYSSDSTSKYLIYVPTNISALTLSAPLAVTSGGTGLTSVTTTNILFGNGTLPIDTDVDFSYTKSSRTISSPGVNSQSINLHNLSLCRELEISKAIVPSSEFTSSTTSFSGELMTATASSVFATSGAMEAFRNSTSRYWQSDVLYNPATGIYVGSTSTLTSGTATSGEWIQLTMGFLRKFVSMTIFSRSTVWTKRAPRKFVLCASKDNITWTTITSASSVIDWAEDVPKTFTFPTNTISYKHYRLVITEIGNLTTGGSSQQMPNISLQYEVFSRMTVQSSLRMGNDTASATFLPPPTTDTNVKYTLPTIAPTDTNRRMGVSSTGIMSWVPPSVRSYVGTTEYTSFGIKHYYGNGTTTNGKMTFYPTTDNTATGTAYFTILLAYPFVTAVATAASNNPVALVFASIDSVSSDYKTVVVNVGSGKGVLLGGVTTQYAGSVLVSIMMIGY